MSNIPKKLLIVSIIILLLLNFTLLYRISNLSSELETWKNKVTLTFDEQLYLLEHHMEGLDLSTEINKLKDLNIKFNAFFSSSKNNKLIYDFGEIGCRRCLNMEIRLYKKFSRNLQNNKIDVIMLFSSLEKVDYLSLIKQFEIENVSVLLNENTINIPRYYESKRNPLTFFINKENHILLANFSDYTNERKSEKFYKKIDLIIKD